MQDQTKEQVNVFVYSGKKCLGKTEQLPEEQKKLITILVDTDENFENLEAENLLGDLIFDYENRLRQSIKRKTYTVTSFKITQVVADKYQIQLYHL